MIPVVEVCSVVCTDFFFFWKSWFILCEAYSIAFREYLPRFSMPYTCTYFVLSLIKHSEKARQAILIYPICLCMYKKNMAYILFCEIVSCIQLIHPFLYTLFCNLFCRILSQYLSAESHSSSKYVKMIVFFLLWPSRCCAQHLCASYTVECDVL